MSSKLFTPLKVGAITVPNRVLMAPLTRLRSIEPGDVPTPLMAEYYRQRASAGLIISEATQQAMLSTDYSVTGSMLTIVTLVSIDILFGYIKKKFAQAENFLDGTPVIVVENGAVIAEKMKLVNISVDDILLAARQHHGIDELKAIKFAILERNGQISIIPEQE